MGPKGLKVIGFLLARNNNYHVAGKELTNVKRATNSDSVVTLCQVEAKFATTVSKGGDVMAGDLGMGDNKITNCGTPPDDWPGALVLQVKTD